MRSSRFSLIVAPAALALGLGFTGCGGDDPKPTQTDQSSITDSQYDAVRAEVNQFVDSTLVLFSRGLDLAAVSTQTDLGEALYGPSRTDSTQTNNFWNTVFSSDFALASTSLWIDSIQYLDANGQPQSFGSGVAGMTYIHNWNLTNNDTTVTYDDYLRHALLNISGLNTAVATISGSSDLISDRKFVSIDSTVWRDYDIQATLTSLSLSQSGGGWTSGCPSSGSIAITVSLTYKLDAASAVTSTWTFDVTFNNGVAAVDVTVGSESASYTQTFCTLSS